MLRDVGGVIKLFYGGGCLPALVDWGAGRGIYHTWAITRAPLALPSIALSLFCEWWKRVSGEPRSAQSSHFATQAAASPATQPQVLKVAEVSYCGSRNSWLH